MSPLLDRSAPPKHRLPGGERLKINPPRHQEFVTPRKCWHHHQLVAADLKQALNNGNFENFTNADDERSVDHPPRRYEIETNRFERFESNKGNYEQSQRGIWAKRTNPASEASENPELGKPSTERLN